VLGVPSVPVRSRGRLTPRSGVVLGVVLGGWLRAGVVPGRRLGGVGRREVLGDDCTGMEGGGCTRSGVLGVGMVAELDAASATDDGAAASTAVGSVPRSRPTWRCGVDRGVASAAPTAARTGAAARGPKASHSLLGARPAAGRVLETALVTALGTALGTRKPRASNPADGVTRAGALRRAPSSVGGGTGGRLPAELDSAAGELRAPGPPRAVLSISRAVLGPPRAVSGPRLRTVPLAPDDAGGRGARRGAWARQLARVSSGVRRGKGRQLARLELRLEARRRQPRRRSTCDVSAGVFARSLKR
jgi:hypothetical protein